MRWASCLELLMVIGLLPSSARGRPARWRASAIEAVAGTNATSTFSAPSGWASLLPRGSRSPGVMRPSSSRSESQVRLWVQSRGTLGLAWRGWLPGWRRSAWMEPLGIR